MKKFIWGLSIIILISCNKDQIRDRQLKNELIAVSKRCYDRGLYWGNGGDISVRIPDSEKFIVKGTMRCLGDLDYSKLTTMNFAGEFLEGDKPSHEAAIHAEIYKIRKDVGAILHMHSPFATAFATVGLTVPPVTQQSASLLRNCGIVKYYKVGSQALVDSVVNYYRNPSTKVVFMENHGAFVVGADLYDLLYNAEKLENTARIAYYAKFLGEPKQFDLNTAY